jgi:hypothetical protein
MDRLIDWWMEEWMDGWMDRQKNSLCVCQRDGETERERERQRETERVCVCMSVCVCVCECVYLCAISLYAVRWLSRMVWREKFRAPSIKLHNTQKRAVLLRNPSFKISVVQVGALRMFLGFWVRCPVSIHLSFLPAPGQRTRKYHQRL